MATTPSFRTDDEEASEREEEITPTVQDTSEPSLAFNHSPWWSDSEEERFDKSMYANALRLDGGEGKENPEGPSADEIAQAVKIARKATARLSKKQMMIIFRIERKTLRRTQESESTKEGQLRLEQILCAAAKRLTMVVAPPKENAATAPDQGGKMQQQEKGSRTHNSNRQGRGHRTRQEAPNNGPSNGHEDKVQVEIGKTGKGSGSGTTLTRKSVRREFQLNPEEWPYPTATLEEDMSNMRADARLASSWWLAKSWHRKRRTRWRAQRRNWGQLTGANREHGHYHQ